MPITIAFPPLAASSCVPVAVVPPPSITFPGGATLQGLLALPGGSRQEIIAGLISQAQAAMAPEAVVLKLAATVTDATTVLTSLAKVPPDPAKAFAAMPALVADIAALASVAPPVSAAPFVKSLLSTIVLLLQGIIDEMAALASQAQRIKAALDLSAVVDDAQLAADLADVAACEQGRLDAQLANHSASMGPLNTVIGLIQPLLAAIPGLPPIPVFGALGSDPTAAVGVLQGLVDALGAIVQVIP